MAKRTFYTRSLTDVGYGQITLSDLCPTVLKLAPNNVRCTEPFQPLEMAMKIGNRKDDHVFFVKLTLRRLSSSNSECNLQFVMNNMRIKNEYVCS